MALSQTCRQIRYEYWPIQHRNSNLNIECGHVNSFLETFYKSKASMMLAPSRLEITLNHSRERRNRLAPALDMVPLIKLRNCMSADRIKFVPKGDRDVEVNVTQCAALNHVLHHRNETWLCDIRTNMIKSFLMHRNPLQGGIQIMWRYCDGEIPIWMGMRQVRAYRFDKKKLKGWYHVKGAYKLCDKRADSYTHGPFSTWC
jgi:hypothetical protein